MYVKLKEIKTYRELKDAPEHLRLDCVPYCLSLVVP